MKFYCILILFICAIPKSSNAQVINEYKFKHHIINQGHINNILRDSEGYIWISSQDGLTKYNGHHWIQFNYNRNDPTSLSHNYVWLTYEDSYKNIWVGTFAGGLCLFNREKQSFETFELGKTRGALAVRSLLQINDDELLVGTDNGLFRFNVKSKRVTQDSIFLNAQREHGLIHHHFLNRVDEDIVISSGENGAFFIDLNSNSVHPLVINGIDNKEIIYTRMHNDKLILIGKSEIYVAENDGGKMNFKLESSILISETLGFSVMYQLGENKFLIGSNNGLFQLDLNNKTVEQFPFNDPKVENGLTDKVIYSIAEIEKDLLWIGSKTKIYELSLRPQQFINVDISKLCNSAILGMHQKDNDLWIGTRTGLSRIKNFSKPKSEWEYFCYSSENVSNFRNNYILNVMDINDELWLGYRRKGATRFTVDENDNLTLLPNIDSFDFYTKDYSVGKMYEDSYNHVWIGTSGNGIIKWNYNTNEFKHFLGDPLETNIKLHPYVFDFLQSKNDELFIATADGFGILDLENDEITIVRSDIEAYSDFGGDFIMDFYEDEDDNIWVMSDLGINLMDGDSIRNWDRNLGLPNDNIYGMEGYGNHKWISSNKGIVQMIANGANYSFKTYGKEKGLLNDEYNQFSHLTTRDSLVIFGGSLGITIFDPRKIKKNDISTKAVIEKFFLYNEEASDVINGHINSKHSISLNHNQNFIGFELSGMSYLDSHLNQFEYKMIGLNENWTSLNTRNYLNFNGLKPGYYKLMIRAANNDGVYGNQIKTLDINIQQPIWNSYAAWILYSVLMIAIVFSIFKVRFIQLRRISEAKENERKIIRERSARDFHDEAGTIITKLSLLSQYLKVNNSQAKNQLNAFEELEDNIQKLRSGMRDFIWVLDPNKDSLLSTIQRIKMIGNNLFEHSDLQFTTSSSITQDHLIELNSNSRRQIILIIKEGLNNILKHAKAKHCGVNIALKENDIVFEIFDDGIGLDLSQVSLGNGINNLKSRILKINGQLHFEARKPHGTLIIMKVPIHPNGG